MPLIRAEEARTEAEEGAHLGERRMCRQRETLTALRGSTDPCVAPEV